jgi:multidrug resistance efflux pump
MAGYLCAVPVLGYQRVKAGTILAEIVDDDYRAAAAQA